MKPSQTPIYRDTERLLQWLVHWSGKLPKSLPMQTLGADVLRDAKTCVDLTAAAVFAGRDGRERRVQLLEALCVKLTAIRSAMRIFSEYRDSKAPVLSTRQYGQFIDLCNKVMTQAGAWLGKTAKVTE